MCVVPIINRPQIQEFRTCMCLLLITPEKQNLSTNFLQGVWLPTTYSAMAVVIQKAARSCLKKTFCSILLSS